MTLPELIKSHRLKMGLTLDDLANATGSSKSFIWEVESGKTGLSFQKAVKISVALNLPINIMAAHLLREIL